MIRRSLRTTIVSALVLSLIGLEGACVSDDPGASEPPSCTNYCTELAKSCGGDKLQYRNNEECMKTCALLDLGTAADGNANTIGCRIRMAKSAKTVADCVAAGPFGGGVCGSRCATFCTIIGKNCRTVASPPFGGSEANCNERCPSFATDDTEGEGPHQHAFPGKDTFNCRSHHLILSLSDPETHCPHADVESTMCR